MAAVLNERGNGTAFLRQVEFVGNQRTAVEQKVADAAQPGRNVQGAVDGMVPVILGEGAQSVAADELLIGGQRAAGVQVVVGDGACELANAERPAGDNATALGERGGSVEADQEQFRHREATP